MPTGHGIVPLLRSGGKLKNTRTQVTASIGSAVVQPYTHDPKFESLIPATEAQGEKK
jgi:hypothetical protein